MQNSAEPEAGSENTTVFCETCNELVRTTERYLEFAQSTRQAAAHAFCRFARSIDLFAPVYGQRRNGVARAIADFMGILRNRRDRLPAAFRVQS